MRVLCFSLNTYQTALCEKYYRDPEANNLVGPNLIKKSFFKFTKRNDCYNPLFFDQYVVSNIEQFTPDVLAFTTVNELDTGTYFHSDFLPEYMQAFNYKAIDREKYTLNNKAIRLSIYVDKNDNTTVAVEPDTNKLQCNDSFALALYLQTNLGLIAFVSIDFTSGIVENCYQNIKDKLLDINGVNAVFLMGDLKNENRQLVKHKSCNNS